LLVASFVPPTQLLLQARSSICLSLVALHYAWLNLLSTPVAPTAAPALAPSNYVDTHAHLHGILPPMGYTFDQYPEFRKKFFPSNLDAIINVSCEPATNAMSLFFLQFDGVYGAIGCHPHEAKHYTQEVEESIIKDMTTGPYKHKILAWGECGLDYHYNNSPAAVQREAFAKQIQAAVKLNKPLVVHTREAEADTLEILRAHLPRDHPTHIHCFTSSAAFATSLISEWSRLCLGFTGVVTFKNSKAVREAVSVVPADRILLETDGPYMSPQSQRGKTCHSGMLPETANSLAQQKNMSLPDFYATVRANTRRIYGI
jgi:TatD DNase family protein